MNSMNKNIVGNKGFTLIELMISLAIGLFLIAGMFTVYINSNKSQRSVEVEVKMLDDARFAIDLIGYDLRHAGMWGRLKESDKIAPSAIAVAGECRAGWSVDAQNPVYGYNDTNPYAGACMSDYFGGDIFEVRYAMSTPIVATDANVLYLYGDVNSSEYLKGGGFVSATPAIGDPQNYPVVARAYYIRSWTDYFGDGVPSLHQVSLQPGPSITDIMILSGVENMQIQFGVDTTGDGAVNIYVNPAAGIDWKKVVSAQVWFVMKSANRYQDIDTSITFNNTPFTASGVLSYPNDGFRRTMVNTVVKLRNR